MRPLLFFSLFVVACAHDHSHEKIEATPYVVELRHDVDVDAFVGEHYLEPTAMLPEVHGFAADLRPATVDVLRADDRVESLRQSLRPDERD